MLLETTIDFGIVFAPRSYRDDRKEQASAGPERVESIGLFSQLTPIHACVCTFCGEGPHAVKNLASIHARCLFMLAVYLSMYA